MVEASVRKHGETLRSQSDGRCDEIAVETGFARGLDDLGQDRAAPPARRRTDAPAARRGRPPRRIPAPCRGVELVVALVERQRIGTIGAAERATMCQFGEQAEGRRQAGAVCRRSIPTPAVSYPRATANQQLSRHPRGCARAAPLKVLARSSTIASSVASPVHRFNISTVIASALNTRSGASRTQPPCASLCVNRTPRGSRGKALPETCLVAACRHQCFSGTKAPGGTCFGAT